MRSDVSLLVYDHGEGYGTVFCEYKRINFSFEELFILCVSIMFDILLRIALFRENKLSPERFKVGFQIFVWDVVRSRGFSNRKFFEVFA